MTTTDATVLEEERPVLADDASPAVAPVADENAGTAVPPPVSSLAQETPLPAARAPDVRPSAAKIERRGEPRYLVRWRAAIGITAEEDTFICQGRMLDISMSGCSMLVGRNLHPDQTVAIYLELPGIHSGQIAKVIEAEGRIAVAMLSSQHDSFFIGLKFTYFKGEAKAQLESRISTLISRPAF